VFRQVSSLTAAFQIFVSDCANFCAALFRSRTALVIVKPATLIGWHRAAFRLFWCWKSRPVGRPSLAPELICLIRRMAAENPTWGEERIADELLLKLQIRLSPRTVGKYAKGLPHPRRSNHQRWSTFIRNHAHEIVACDFFISITASSVSSMYSSHSRSDPDVSYTST
jgi:putative transposase